MGVLRVTAPAGTARGGPPLAPVLGQAGIKVADFGLSYLTSAEDETNPVYWALNCGTEGYKAPESIPFEDPIWHKPVDDFKILSPCNGK